MNGKHTKSTNNKTNTSKHKLQQDFKKVQIVQNLFFLNIVQICAFRMDCYTQILKRYDIIVHQACKEKFLPQDKFLCIQL